MTDPDIALRTALRQAQQRREDGRVPDFAGIWAAAEHEARSRRKRRGVLAGVAAAAAAAMVATLAVGLLPSRDGGFHYLDVDELLETTRWSAPSDTLLPEREFDIYQEVPVLNESTETIGGTLL